MSLELKPRNRGERIAGARGGQFLNKTRTKGSEKAETPSNIPREINWKFGRELSANHARVYFGSANNELPGNNPTNGGIRARGRAPANRARIHGEFIFSRRALRGVEGARFSDLGQLFAALVPSALTGQPLLRVAD